MRRIPLSILLAWLAAACPSCERGGTQALSGTVEATVTELSFKLPGIVKERRVSEGDQLSPGQVIARLDDAELRLEVELKEAELAAAEAALALLAAGAREEEVTQAYATYKSALAVLEALEKGAREEEVAQAEAAVAQARAGLDNLSAGARRQEIAMLEAAAKASASEEERLSAELARQEELSSNGLTSFRDLDRTRTGLEAARARRVEAEQSLLLAREGPRKEAIDQAKAVLAQASAALALVKAGARKETLDQARAGLEKAKAALDLVRAGARKETLDQAKARVEQAKASLGLSEQRLNSSVLLAPHAGLVLAEGARAGEYVSPGTTVVTLGDLSEVWLRAYLAEPDLGRVKLGDEVSVTTDSWPGRSFKGRITFIASEAEFTPKNVQTREERAKLVYRVKIVVPNPNLELKPGMPADAEIVPSGR